MNLRLTGSTLMRLRRSCANESGSQTILKSKIFIIKLFLSLLPPQTQFDQDSMGRIEYWPLQGFPAESYPYENQKNYLSPFVLVRLRKVRQNVPISIECRAYDQNITINKLERIGYLQFELMIEVESVF